MVNFGGDQCSEALGSSSLSSVSNLYGSSTSVLHFYLLYGGKFGWWVHNCPKPYLHPPLSFICSAFLSRPALVHSESAARAALLKASPVIVVCEEAQRRKGTQQDPLTFRCTVCGSVCSRAASSVTSGNVAVIRRANRKANIGSPRSPGRLTLSSSLAIDSRAPGTVESPRLGSRASQVRTGVPFHVPLFSSSISSSRAASPAAVRPSAFGHDVWPRRHEERHHTRNHLATT